MTDTRFAFALVAIFFIALACTVAQRRHRRVRLAALAAAVMPELPISFHWNWWALGVFTAIPVFILVFTLGVGVAVGPNWPIVLPGLPVFLAAVSHVHRYLRFASKGPSFVIDAQGITFAGQYLRWRDIRSIDYLPESRTPFIRFRNDDSQARGFSMFDQFYGKTSVSTTFIDKPDELAAWSQRLLEGWRTEASAPAPGR